MRAQLEGKAYVERYVQTLTHELKSPLAAIQGASELLRQDLPAEQRARLPRQHRRRGGAPACPERATAAPGAGGAAARAGRTRCAMPLRSLVDELIAGARPRPARAARRVDEPRSARDALQSGASASWSARRWPTCSTTRSTSRRRGARDTDRGGPGSAAGCSPLVAIRCSTRVSRFPDYALARVTERFYSLPRPATGRKSTGLGLNFVQEVADLHGGAFPHRQPRRRSAGHALPRFRPRNLHLNLHTDLPRSIDASLRVPCRDDIAIASLSLALERCRAHEPANCFSYDRRHLPADRAAAASR